MADDDYKRESPSDWSEKASRSFIVRKTSTGFVLEGNCPHCGHSTATPLTSVKSSGGIQMFWKKKHGDGTFKPPTGSLVIVCACGMEHTGRPEGKRGCGRFGKVRLRRKGT